MKESFESNSPLFTFPSIAEESGEFARVAETFSIDSSVLMFLAQNGELMSLDENMWQDLENTDSNRLEAGEWKKVAEFSDEAGRDWMKLRDEINARNPLNAPIIMQSGERYHLVSGNTRLMVARAAGITPTVLLFTVDSTANGSR